MANRLVTFSAGMTIASADVNGEINNIVNAGTIDRTGGRWGALDDVQTTFGTSQDCTLRYSTTQTNDTLVLGLNVAQGGCLLVVDNADVATDFGISGRANPSFILHSSDATTAADYIEFYHDQTNAIINAGTGGISFLLAATQALILTGASGSAILTAGSGGDITLVVGAGKGVFLKAGTRQAGINDAGDFYPSTDNVANLGITVSNRWKDVFAVTKTSVLNVPWTASKVVLVSVLEGPEYRLYDCGTAVLDVVGKAIVQLDPKFEQIISGRLQVLTGGARVTVRTDRSFTLQGAPGDTVDWMVVATRAGFENVRWRTPDDPEPRGLADPWNACDEKSADNNTPREKARRKRDVQ